MSGLARSDSLTQIGRLVEARAQAEAVVQSAERFFGESDSLTALALNSLGALCWNSREYDNAEELWLRALKIRESILPADHPEIAQSLANLAASCYHQGRLDQAIARYERALQIYRSTWSNQHHVVAVVATNLATIYADQGRYSSAEALFKEALSIRQHELGEDHPSVAAGIRDLGMLYVEQGRFAEAEDEYLRALEIQRRIYLPHYANSPEIGRTLSAIGALYALIGRGTEAEHELRKALTIYGNSLGDHHPDVAQAMIELAMVCANQQRFDEADSLVVRAQAIYDKLHQGLSREAVDCMENHALLEWAQGKIAGADSLFSQALSSFENLLTPEHLQTLRCCENYAVFLSLQRDHARAHELAGRAYRGLREILITDGSALPERTALQFAHTVESAADDYLSVLFNGRSVIDNWEGEAAALIASSKGLVTTIVSSRFHPNSHDLSAEAVVLNDSLRLARFALATLRQSDFSLTDGVFYRRLTAAVARKEECETKLAKISVEFRDSRDQLDITEDDLTNHVPADAVLIDYFKYQQRVGAESSEPQYVAVVWRPHLRPEVVMLGSADSSDASVAWYRSYLDNFGSQDPADYDIISADLYARLWAPLADLLDNARTVFIAPDADLNLVSFAGLKDPEGRFLIETWAIHYLTSVRDLHVPVLNEQKVNSGLLALGDPDFDIDFEDKSNRLDTLDHTNVCSSQVTPSHPHVLPASAAHPRWERLPKSAHEAQQTSTLWNSQFSEPSDLFTGQDATEKRLKLDARKYRVIHLATHSFSADRKSNKTGSRTFAEQRFVGENPLLQSGLVFAGANVRPLSLTRDTEKDGIMTAEEIVGLDLSGTELVLLSACETALGEIKSRDGVFGLRRAFELAGAKTVVSTLWKIQDQAATDIMPLLLAQGLPLTPGKVQRVVVDHLHDLRSRGLSTHPYFWAGFVVSGRWN